MPQYVSQWRHAWGVLFLLWIFLSPSFSSDVSEGKRARELGPTFLSRSNLVVKVRSLSLLGVWPSSQYVKFLLSNLCHAFQIPSLYLIHTLSCWQRTSWDQEQDRDHDQSWSRSHSVLVPMTGLGPSPVHFWSR